MLYILQHLILLHFFIVNTVGFYKYSIIQHLCDSTILVEYQMIGE